MMSYESAQAHYDHSIAGNDDYEDNLAAHEARVGVEEAYLRLEVDDALDAVIEYLTDLPEEALDILQVIVDASIHAPYKERNTPINSFVTLALRKRAEKLVTAFNKNRGN